MPELTAKAKVNSLAQPAPSATDSMESLTLEQELLLCEKLGMNKEALRERCFDIYQLIEIRKGLQSKVDIRQYLNPAMPWTEMEEIRRELEDGIDMSEYREKGFSLDQIREIRKGLKYGLDVSGYARKEYFAEQMRELRHGLKAGLPVMFYSDPAFDARQMAEIRRGLETNVDISFYARPEIPARKMKVIRESMKDGLVFTEEQIGRFDADILNQLHQAFLVDINIKPYIEEHYDARQLEEIRKTLVQHLDVDTCMQPEMHSASLREIRIGMEEGLDVSVYAKLEYNWQQMHEIRLGLENRLDVSAYLNPDFESRQMEQIRLGLQENLDVSGYASLMYTPLDMQQIREKLEEDGDVRTIDVRYLHLGGDEDEAGTPGYSGDGSAAASGESAQFLRITDDKLQAYLHIPKPEKNAPPYTLETILGVLSRAGIVRGIRKSVIIRIFAENLYDQDVLVAEGKAPVIGRDGYYEYFFDKDLPTAPAIGEDGEEDYTDVEYFYEVSAGDKLAVYHGAIPGENGYDIRDKILPGRSGHEQKILVGQGFIVMKDKHTYCSTVSGVVTLSENELNIHRLLTLPGLTKGTDAVDFAGSIWVRGDMDEGTELHASGDVIVDGFVHDARIIASGNVVLRQGANGDEETENALVQAGGSVTGKYFHNMTIRAGKDVRSGSLLNCQVHTEGQTVCPGARGTISGGHVDAMMGVETSILGNAKSGRTLVSLGITGKLQAQYNENEKLLERLLVEMESFQVDQVRLNSIKQLSREQLQYKIKLNAAMGQKNKEIAARLQAKAAIQNKISMVSNAMIEIHKTLYAGSVIMIDGMALEIPRTRNERNGIVFRKEDVDPDQIIV